MDLSWDGLNKKFLGCDPAKELDWCRREHLEYSTPARLAHYIVCGKELKAASSNEVPEEHSGIPDKYQRMPLPKPSDPVEQWRELLEWRHPQIDLNLLQLAVIFSAPYCINYLNEPIFTRAEHYRDEKSVLVNHAFHLACRLGCSWIQLLMCRNLPDEVVWEGGTVDLSQARIQRLSSSENQEISNAVDPSANGTPKSSTGSVCVANENELLALMGRNNVTVNQISLGLTPTVGTCFSLTAEDDDMCVTHLFMHALNELNIDQHPQSSSVEYLWEIVGSMCRRGITVKCFTWLVYIFSEDCVRQYRRILQSTHFLHMSEEEALSWKTYYSEATMLVCQLSACVAENTGSWTLSRDKLRHLFVDMIDIAGVESVQRAASYLPRKHLPSIVRYLQGRRQRTRANSNSFLNPQRALALNMFTDMAEETNLENLCVLKILESVRGDARAARSLSVLPEPLRELFHVPFQDLYDQLTAGNQA